MTRAPTLARRLAPGLALLGALTPGLAAAGNAQHPRTPVLWDDAPCMTVIDRSQGAVHSFRYSIPYEDTDVTVDEVDNSRTHQFFAFCRDHHLEEILPGWITEADLQAAGDKGLGDPGTVDTELHILDNAPEWADCAARITGDDERRPITFAAAAEPVLWDTGTLAAGTWVIEGYTYEPWFNLWSPHPGVVKIVDDPDPAASPPAAALTFAEQTVVFGDDASITGCVDAMAGTTMTLSWSNGNISGEPNWEVYAADLPADTGSFDLSFTPPAEAVSNSVMLRLDLEDPMGREWTAFSNAYIAVVDASGGDESCDDEGGFVSNPCDEGESSAEDDGVDEAEGPTLMDSGEEGGCACDVTPTTPPGWAALGLWILLGAGLRRRRAASGP